MQRSALIRRHKVMAGRFWNPNIPEEIRLNFKALCKAHGVSQWQGITAAMMVLMTHKRLDKLMSKVKNEHSKYETPDGARGGNDLLA